MPLLFVLNRPSHIVLLACRVLLASSLTEPSPDMGEGFLCDIEIRCFYSHDSHRTQAR